jgi:hypothetical protein
MVKNMKKLGNSMEDLAKIAGQSEDVSRKKPVLIKRKDMQGFSDENNKGPEKIGAILYDLTDSKVMYDSPVSESKKTSYEKIDWKSACDNVTYKTITGDYEVYEENLGKFNDFQRKVAERHNGLEDMDYSTADYVPMGRVSKHLRDNRKAGVFSDVETVADKICSALENAVTSDKFYTKNVGYDKSGSIREMAWENKDKYIDIPMEIVRPSGILMMYLWRL